MWVYLLPAQTKADVWPLGGDIRYLFSADGTQIVAQHRMHNSVLEFKTPADGAKPAAGYHSAVVDTKPEDSDVFYVLSRKPSIPEYVVTRTLLYVIAPDGKITLSDKKMDLPKP